MQFLLGFLLVVTAAFLIMIVLLQRGRGGGLAGAFGGMGGQSAFGAKAGDLFTKITIGVATFWILLCIASVKILNQRSNPFGSGGTNSKAPASPDAAGGATSTTGDKAGSAASTGSGTTAPGKTDSGAKSDGGGAAPTEKPAAPAATPPAAAPPATTPSK